MLLVVLRKTLLPIHLKASAYKERIMDWEALINVISDSIKDDSLREDIYRKLLIETEDFYNSEDCLGSDDVFDKVWEELSEENNDDDEDVYDDGDDFGYQDD